MLEWISIKSGYRFWYEVKFEYRINGSLKLDWSSRIGLAERRTILNERACKKIEYPLHLMKDVENRYLNNGTINMQVISYLGYLKLKK